jgi:hypothetical protein
MPSETVEMIEDCWVLAVSVGRRGLWPARVDGLP